MDEMKGKSPRRQASSTSKPASSNTWCVFGHVGFFVYGNGTGNATGFASLAGVTSGRQQEYTMHGKRTQIHPEGAILSARLDQTLQGGVPPQHSGSPLATAVVWAPERRCWAWSSFAVGPWWVNPGCSLPLKREPSPRQNPLVIHLPAKYHQIPVEKRLRTVSRSDQDGRRMTR